MHKAGLSTVEHFPVAASHWPTTHAPLPVHSTQDPGLVTHLNGALLVSQISLPLHKFSSSLLAQSGLDWQPHRLLPGVHTPPAHKSPCVQGLSSSHGTKPLTATALHAPVAMSQVFFMHALSSPDGHTTTVAGLTRHWCGVVLAQYSLPLQALPSSLLAQSPSTSHTQVLVPDWHSPPTHESNGVHGLPSSHAWPLLTNTLAHLPVFLSHWFLAHTVSNALGHTTTDAGLGMHLCSALVLSQYSVPLQELPSSSLAQSASFWHGQVLMPPWHCPTVQVSLAVHGLPSSHLKVGDGSPGNATSTKHCSPAFFCVTASMMAKHLVLVFSMGNTLHCAVLASHALRWHWVSSTVGHTTTVAGLKAHTGLAPDLSQYSVPLHKSPSSSLAQSLSRLHEHCEPVLVLVHLPSRQTSLAVQGSPSLQARLAMGVSPAPSVSVKHCLVPSLFG